ncbi:MAG: hypothetical protein HYW06_04285 [Gemmatimonadetes bacterium]|nr:hypothetical protein [Gemmatimonadota bacterium]MBI2536181.1 hypothetical protein [Gemmatimonadota bacterium]MBI2615915.1 hypothetical protein [Gemmatimonadota bacterium]
MVRLLALVSWMATAAPQLPGQQTSGLATRLDQATYAALRPILEAAGRDSIPLRPLEAKALEGTAKRRPAAQIVAAVQRLAQELQQARLLLRQAAPTAPDAEGDIVAAAEAMRRGVPAEEVAALRRRVPPATSLEIPLAVLGELVQRGVPAAEARAVIEHMVNSGVPQARMVEIPSHVDVALRVGAPPITALGSALQSLGIPVPPPGPGGLGPRRPPGDRG